MYGHERIRLHDSMETVFAKMSEGNPGALDCLCRLYKEGPRVDPDHCLKGFGAIIQLDSVGLYGVQLYLLWSDVCSRNVVKMVGVLRASAFGFISHEDLRKATQEPPAAEIDIEDLLAKVRERLPNFTTDDE